MTAWWHGVRPGSVVGAMLIALAATAGDARQFASGLSPELQRIVDSHPGVRRLTDWGSRPDWSPDGRRLLYLSRDFGDVFELDVATGRTRPLTFGFPHHGVLRAQYLANGDYLITAAPSFDAAAPQYSRFFESQLYILKADLSGPPIPLGIRNYEGTAVSRRRLRIAWVEPQPPFPARQPDAQLYRSLPTAGLDRYRLWTGDIVYRDGRPSVVNRRMVFDCAAPGASLGDRRCGAVEPQDFVPPGDDAVIVSLATSQADAAPAAAMASASYEPYRIDLASGRATRIVPTNGHNEPEGIFPDGRATLVEHADGPLARDSTRRIDLWRLALDGSGRMTQLTHYHRLDPRLKSDQGVISPDGRWMAFTVSTGESDDTAQGQGVGLYLMDLRAAGAVG